MNNKQLFLLFHIGFLVLLPLVGTSIFNTTRNFYEYAVNGYYYYDCVTGYMMEYFTRESFDICRGEDIRLLAFEYAVSIAVFVFMANAVRKTIIKELVIVNK